MIAYFAADLIWMSRIGAACKAASIDARPIADAGQVESLLEQAAPEGAVIDLGESRRALEILEALRRRLPKIRIVAFGPHVDRETLDRARRLGADEVVPRSVMANRLEDLLRWAATGSESA